MELIEIYKELWETWNQMPNNNESYNIEIKDVLTELQGHLTGDFCKQCLKLITDNELILDTEPRGNFQDIPVSETVVIGFQCSNCGTKEMI